MIKIKEKKNIEKNKNFRNIISNISKKIINKTKPNKINDTNCIDDNYCIIKKNENSNNITKKKIVIVTDNFYPRIDGISVFLINLIPFLLDDFDVHIIAPDFKDKNIEKSVEYNFNFKVTRIPLTKMFYGDYQIPKAPKNIENIIKECDLVFIQTIGVIGNNATKISKKHKKPLFAFAHSIERILVRKSLSKNNPFNFIASNIAKSYSKKVYNRCNGIIVPSSSVGHILSKDGIVSQKYVVTLGVDHDKFKPLYNKIRKEELKLSLGFEKDDFIIGYVGRIAREKDLPTLFKAFKNIEHDKKKLLIVGSGIESIKKNALEELKNNVFFIGSKFDITPYLNAMDLFVMPSLVETTCIAILEAMSCGIPIISTKVGSIPEYIIDKENGMLFPKGNSTILKLKIQQLIKDDLKRNYIAKSGRKTIETKFNFEISAKKIKKIFKSII
jgi:glycosyltransferase involved in cell wall biosynthesis